MIRFARACAPNRPEAILSCSCGRKRGSTWGLRRGDRFAAKSAAREMDGGEVREMGWCGDHGWFAQGPLRVTLREPKIQKRSMHDRPDGLLRPRRPRNDGLDHNPPRCHCEEALRPRPCAGEQSRQGSAQMDCFPAQGRDPRRPSKGDVRFARACAPNRPEAISSCSCGRKRGSTPGLRRGDRFGPGRPREMDGGEIAGSRRVHFV